MTPNDRISDRIRRGESIPKPLAGVLSAFTPVTRAGMWWRQRRTPTRVDARVISFGNLTAGGTGKTPAVIERAQRELENDARVCVLTRGYGSEGPSMVDSRSIDSVDYARLLGDEAALILQHVPEAVVVKNADRVEGARHAVSRHRCDVLLLDDGFQYTYLARDENVLMIDAANPFGNGKLLPRGILREPISEISRATHVVLTRCDQADDLSELEATIREHAPDAPIRKTIHAPTILRDLEDHSERELSFLDGQKVVAVCGIGHPESFFATLESLGAIITQRIAFRDHASLQESDIPTEGMVVLTEKDAVRTKLDRPNTFALGIAIRDFDGE